MALGAEKVVTTRSGARSGGDGIATGVTVVVGLGVGGGWEARVVAGWPVVDGLGTADRIGREAAVAEPAERERLADIAGETQRGAVVSPREQHIRRERSKEVNRLICVQIRPSGEP